MYLSRGAVYFGIKIITVYYSSPKILASNLFVFQISSILWFFMLTTGIYLFVNWKHKILYKLHIVYINLYAVLCNEMNTTNLKSKATAFPINIK